MNALGWLVLGLLIGWAIEFAIDFLYWRKKAQDEAEALARQEATLEAQQTELGHRQSALRLREGEMADLQASLASRDAELLQQARRVEERSDDLSRVEQAIEKRRADLDRMGLALNERDKEIASRGEQLRSKEINYSRRIDTLESTEQELGRRMAVVSNREEAMQSWEARILSREHEVADREASVNYHASRMARDAAGFAATKHLLRQHYYTADGHDRLQALVGIDEQVAELLQEAGIRSFERLAETPVGELTRLMERAGPRLALANPMSWAEQASMLLAEDWVGLDQLQAELNGEQREHVAEHLLAAIRQGQTAPQPPEGSVNEPLAGAASSADRADESPPMTQVEDAQAGSAANASANSVMVDEASGSSVAEGVPMAVDVALQAGQGDGSAASDDGVEATLDQQSVVWEPDAGDEYEDGPAGPLAPVFVNRRAAGSADVLRPEPATPESVSAGEGTDPHYPA